MSVTINGSTASSYWTFKLVATEGTPNIAGNTSPLTVDVYIGRGASAGGSYMHGASIAITVNVTGCNAQSIKYSNANKVNVAAGGWLHIGSTTFAAVPHDSDGSKTVTVSASFTNNVSPKSGSASGSVVLTTIARASQPSCVTWPEHTQDVGEFGDTISIHMNRKSDSFKHTVRYAFGTLTGTIATGVETGTTWKIPESFMDKIPNATKGSGTIYVDTYNGSTKIGTKFCGFTATVPASVMPTVSATLTDTTAVDDIYGKPVAGLSKIKVTSSATKAYSSAIKSYRITIDGATYDEQTVTTGVLQQAGTSKVTVTATDERGRTGSWSYDMTVLSYTRPQVTELAVHRTDGDYTENDQGEYVCVTFSTAVDDMDGKNQADYTLRYKKTTEDTWATINLAEIDHNFNIFHYTVLFAASVSSSYDVELTAADRHHSATRATSASTAFSLMDWHNSGTGLRFGGVAEEAYTFQNDLHLRQTGNRYAFSTPGEAGKDGFINMARIKVTAANADTPITFVLSRRQAESTMTVHVRLNNSTATTSTVASVRYEGSNYGAFIAPGEDSLTWDLYVQKGSAYDTVTIQDWWTSKTMQSRVAVTFPGSLVDTVPTPYWRAGPLVAESILDCFFPVGFVLILYSHADPNTMYPGSTWERIENRFLWGCDPDGDIGTMGGEKTHTLTVAEMPSHTHKDGTDGTKGMAVTSGGQSAVVYYDAATGRDTTATGGGQAHNNMPPYVQVSIWRRTA